MPVEKNEVDISRLFSWKKKITVSVSKTKKITAYMRILGDADVGKVRVQSLRRSAEFRKALRDVDSDEHLAFIPDRAELSREAMQDSILVYTMRELTKRAMQDAVIKSPKEPSSDAPTEIFEKYQKEVDEYPELRERTIRELLEKYIAEKREILAAKTEDELYKEFLQAIINELCEQELLQRFKELCVFYGTFADRELTKRLFKSLDEFLNLPKETKDEFIMLYSGLDIESELLKK